MKILRTGLGVIALLFALMITLFILADTLKYWDFEIPKGFLNLKSYALAHFGWLYLPAFYVHISCATLVALVGMFQFWGWLRRKAAAVHRWAGRVYVVVVLFLAAPSGFAMAWFSDGGIAGVLCFLCLAGLWWFTTWKAWRTIRAGDVAAHRRWMIRSYTLTAAAILLRFMIATVINLGLERTDELYALLAWASWLPGLLIVETLFRIFPGNFQPSDSLKKK